MVVEFAGKRAVVTGGAGAIGSEICRQLVAGGAEVWALDRRSAGVAGVQDLVADVASRAAVEAAAAVVGGTVDILVNGHGLQIRASAMNCTDDDLAQIFDVNVAGALRCVQTFAPRMADGGAIVNIASINGIVAAKTGAAYGASKAALIHLTRILALELAPRIRVNAVAPTVVRSAMTADLFERPEYERSKIDAIPMQRIATPGDVAGSVLFLAGSASSYLTGQILAVDGGISLP